MQTESYPTKSTLALAGRHPSSAEKTIMNFTRVDTKKLLAAITKAEASLEQARAALAPFTVVLTDAERGALPRPPSAFPDAARSLARAALSQPDLAAVVGFDTEAVTEDLDNATAIVAIAEKATALAQLVADTRLQWLAEAYSPSLALYAVAKVKAKTDGSITPVVDPIATVFTTRRSRPRKDETPTDK